MSGPKPKPAEQPATATTTAATTPPAESSTAGASTDIAARYETTDRDPKYHKPSHYAGTSWGGYTWNKADLDNAMHRYAIGDVEALLSAAAALDRGDKILSADELHAAGAAATAYVHEGMKMSVGLLAEMRQGTGIASETALVRAARRLDDGDKTIERHELSAAAETLQRIINANDTGAVRARIDSLKDHPRVKTLDLGSIDGHPVRALQFAAKNQPAKLNVLVTAGVHGSEPCGTGAALLLIDQLLKDGALGADVSFTVVPLMNPRGFDAGTRRTPEGDDLNRHFHLEHQDPDHRPEEVEMLESLLEKSTPELVLDLHSGGANRQGFWLYHKNGAKMGEAVMKRLGETYPLLHPQHTRKTMPAPGVIESDPGPAGVAHKGTLKDFAMDHGAKWAFTVEAPGSVSYLDQVMGENEIVRHMVEAALAEKQSASVPLAPVA